MARETRLHKRGIARFGLNERGEPVDRAVEGFLELLLKESPFKLKAFVVFGSRARGDWRPWSDIPRGPTSGRTSSVRCRG